MGCWGKGGEEVEEGGNPEDQRREGKGGIVGREVLLAISDIMGGVGNLVN